MNLINKMNEKKLMKLFKRFAEEGNSLWEIIYPIALKGMFVFWFIIEVVKPVSLFDRIIWYFISMVFIITSWCAVFNSILKWKPKNNEET